MADSDIYNLEFLSLVAKITQEIDNHTGIRDKTLAEFVISLHDQSKALPEFKQKLKDVGADFPESFVENMDRLILNMHPKHKKGSRLEANPKKFVSSVVTSDVGTKKAMLKSDEDGRSPKRQRRDRSFSPPRRRDSSPPRGRGREDRGDDRRGRNGRPTIDEKPILFKIYNGRVSGMKDFGAFVSLEGIAGRVEGLYCCTFLSFSFRS